jgi:hypothetical protein
MLRVFRSWHEPIETLVLMVSPGDVLRHDVAELAAPLRSFHAGRVALLGDAAHPMTPNLGQGACQAIEDAVVLARLVPGPGSGEMAVEQALAAYTAQRLSRTTQVVRWSRRMGATTVATGSRCPRRSPIRPDPLHSQLAPGAGWAFQLQCLTSQAIQHEDPSTARRLKAMAALRSEFHGRCHEGPCATRPATSPRSSTHQSRAH